MADAMWSAVCSSWEFCGTSVSIIAHGIHCYGTGTCALVGHTITIDWIFMDPNLRKEHLRKLLESQGCRHGYGEGLQHE